MKRTVITHFFNEERMLRWWLPHHLKFFDDGILINHNSTDRSVEICRSLAPHWTIVDTRLPNFGAVENDREVMDYEASVSGWKMALNVSEFLVCDPKVLNETLQSMETAGQFCMQTRGAVMVDNQPDKIADPEKPLVEQKFCGYIEDEQHYSEKLFSRLRTTIYNLQIATRQRSTRRGMRNRIIHANVDGAYRPGRHKTRLKIDRSPSFIHTLWYGFSPWDPEMLFRKQQFKHRIPDTDLAKGMGSQHAFNGAELDTQYQIHLKKSRDLMDVIRCSGLTS